MLRHVAAGALGAILGVAAFLIGMIGISLGPTFLETSLDGPNTTGAGGVAIVVNSGSVIIAAVLGFGLGYYWSRRRAKAARPRRDTPQ
jgi:hypothetical protein